MSDAFTPPLPTQAEFVATLPTLIGVIGGKTPVGTVTHVLWIDLGYVGSQFVPGTKAAKKTTDEELVKQLKDYHAAAQSKMTSTETPSAIDWITLFQKILALLQGLGILP